MTSASPESNTGDADLATVLAQYPEQRAALEPMLRAALAVQAAPAPQVAPQARVDGRARLAAALMARLPAEALDQAFAALQQGISVDEALADNPHADELRPLLRMTLKVEENRAARPLGKRRLLAMTV